MVPRPVYGLLFLYPIKKESEAYAAAEAEELKKQVVPSDLWFTKQTVGNACGTVGVLHLLASLRNTLKFKSGSWLESFFVKTEKFTPDQRAQELEMDESIEASHATAEKASEAKDENENVDTHFVALVQVDGILFEMDGRKESPVSHGVTSPETFLNDAVAVVKKFMERDPGEIRFNMIAMTGSSGE
eukprot:GHVR01025974.1.p1 GENE.GHVR01025974.1~~GHVR01025974.1.p1  ORF type:complete len:187 (+),score=34.62 GHVR01025974.1:352-912(+)